MHPILSSVQLKIIIELKFSYISYKMNLFFYDMKLFSSFIILNFKALYFCLHLNSNKSNKMLIKLMFPSFSMKAC